MNIRSSLQAISSVAVKEFIHIYRDWRILVLVLILPPVFTLIFGHAFESTEASDVPALLEDRDHSPQSEQFVQELINGATFKWRLGKKISGQPDLLREHVQAALVIPEGWGASLKNGDPIALPLYLDGSNTNTVSELEGRIQEKLGEFQKKQLEAMVEGLPDNVIDLAKKLPVDVRNQFISAMSQWGLASEVLYNPAKRFIDYVVPGVIGVILQLLTVTLTACTIARERESGTLYQLMVTSLRRGEIVIGKILPYLAISILLILVVIVVAGWHFHVQFHDHFVLALICLLFPALLVRAGASDLSLLAHPNTGHPAFGFLSPSGLCAFRSVCSAGTTATRDPLSLGMLSADPLLPGVSTGESLSRRAHLLWYGSHLPPPRGGGDLRRRRAALETHRAMIRRCFHLKARDRGRTMFARARRQRPFSMSERNAIMVSSVACIISFPAMKRSSPPR